MGHVALLNPNGLFGQHIDKHTVTLLPEAGCDLRVYVEGIYCTCLYYHDAICVTIWRGWGGVGGWVGGRCGKNGLLDNMGKGGWVYNSCLVYSCLCNSACAFGYSGQSKKK